MSATATITSTENGLKVSTSGAMRMDGTDHGFGDFRDDLSRDGFAVVKGAIAKEKALEYADKMYSWLENL